MRELSIHDQARRLILAATGEEYGDGRVVMDVAHGYAEPGYGSDDAVVVFGNWNPKRFSVREGEAPISKEETIGPRLHDALVRAGAECEWYDEWAQCGECYRALRTNADSYAWTMFGSYGEDGITCADCMRRYPDDYLSEYVNDAHKAITWCGPAELTDAGFMQWEPDDPHIYENGWHPGQDDDPRSILASILEQAASAEVVFLINSVGQFDMRFSAWVR